MTVYTQSGFPVIPDYGDPRIVKTSPINAAPGVLAGDVHTVMEWVMRQFDRTVTPLIPAQCWGYAPRQIRGGTGWSNHASGTAVDLNATMFPQGKRYMSRAQVGACRQIVAQSGGAIRWGGDYGGSTAVDQQHFEITSPAAAHVLALRLTAKPTQEDDMPLSDADIDRIAKVTVDRLLVTEVTATDAAAGPNGSTVKFQIGAGKDNLLARLIRVTTLTQDWVRKVGPKVATKEES